MNFIEAVKAVERGQIVQLKSKDSLFSELYKKLVHKHPARLYKNGGCFYTVTTDEILSTNWIIVDMDSHPHERKMNEENQIEGMKGEILPESECDKWWKIFSKDTLKRKIFPSRIHKDDTE
jgi:hypothetical protein